MKCTSAEAAKILRKLTDEQAALKEKEDKSAVFVAAVGENVEDVRPVYRYRETREKLAELEARVRALKHAINTFNLTAVVPGFDMTVDQMLVYIPQLSEQKRRLTEMAARLPKERVTTNGYGARNIIEYNYANYDIAEEEADLVKVSDELARAQTALDVVNNSVTFEIPD